MEWKVHARARRAQVAAHDMQRAACTPPGTQTQARALELAETWPGPEPANVLHSCYGICATYFFERISTSSSNDGSLYDPPYIAELLVEAPFSKAIVVRQEPPTLAVTESLMRVVVSVGP